MHPSNPISTSTTRAIVLLWLFFGTITHGASFLIHEPFDYDTVFLSEPLDLTGLGEVGSGWAGSWEIGRGEKTSSEGHPQYASTHQGKSLNRAFLGTGYSDEVNSEQTGSIRTNQAGGNPAAIAVREFTEPLTGNVWISFLAMSPEAEGDALVWLGSTTAQARGNEIAFGLRSKSATLRAAGEDFQEPVDEQVKIHLFLAMVQSDLKEGESAVQVWVDPDVSSGEASMGEPTFRSAPGDNILSSDLAGVGVSLNANGSSIDDLRISNDLNSLLNGKNP